MRKWLLPGLLITLSLLSVLIIKSISPALASAQSIYFVLGAGVFVSVYKLGFNFWKNLSWMLFAGLILGLLITLTIGLMTGTPGRWIRVGSLFSMQPSQFVIPIVGLVLVKNLTHHDVKSSLDLLRIGAIVSTPALLIFLEPDLGTTLLFLASITSLVWVSQIKLDLIFKLLGTTLLVLVFAWLFIFRDYQKTRITSFLAHTEDLSASGYNARQALIAAGSGQFWGQGLGSGTQSHLRFLPERETDFIFASTAEEVGFLGSTTLVIIYALLVTICLKTAALAKDKAEFYMCLIAATNITLQTGVNIGMNIGLLPITGITLPLMSYGGSSIISFCFFYGMIYSISRQQSLPLKLHLS